MNPETALALRDPLSVALPDSPDDQQTLVAIARKRAQQNAEELEHDAQKAQQRLVAMTQAAVSAFNQAYPRLRITAKPLTKRQKAAFTAFIADQPPPLTPAQIGRAAVQLMAEVNGRELLAEQRYWAEIGEQYDERQQEKQLLLDAAQTEAEPVVVVRVTSSHRCPNDGTLLHMAQGMKRYFTYTQGNVETTEIPRYEVWCATCGRRREGCNAHWGAITTPEAQAAVAHFFGVGWWKTNADEDA